MPTFLNLPFAHLALNNNRSLYSRHWDKGKNDCLLRSIELVCNDSCITRFIPEFYVQGLLGLDIKWSFLAAQLFYLYTKLYCYKYTFGGFLAIFLRLRTPLKQL